ncbi:sensor domain-containing diguanylate cyclase [Myxococcota bacterium]|nr:sensor domain-containing diguanylate cyclase [Myxococcota bacterium]
MKRRIGIFGLTEETLTLISLLLANPDVEIGGIFESASDGDLLDPRDGQPPGAVELHGVLETHRVSSASDLARDSSLHAIVDGSGNETFASLFPDAADQGFQIVTPLTARLLWGYGTPGRDTQPELLQTLQEILDSYDFTVDASELFERMLETARGAIGANGGSLMLLDAQSNALTVEVAVGVEPELWEKIRVPLGEGIAGKAAAEARPLRLRGKADHRAFQILHERLDVVSALCVPLVHEGRVLGVLNLHHTTRADVFSDDDFKFVQQLAKIESRIIARAQEHSVLRNQAARYATVQEVQDIVGNPAPFSNRLGRLCRFAAARAGGGIATLYLLERESDVLHVAATSLSGDGYGVEHKLNMGQGIDGIAAQTREANFLRASNGGIAYAALPLLAGDVLVGVLALQAGPQMPRGRAAEELLLALGAAAAEGIAREQRELSASMRAAKIAALNEAGIRLIASGDSPEVTRLGASEAAMVFQADHAILRLQDEETGRYVIRSYFGSADAALQHEIFRFDKQICVETIKRREPRLSKNLARDPEYRSSRAGLESLLSAPLKRDGQVLGTLSLYDKITEQPLSTASFDDEDLHLFAKYIGHLEHAISNARLQKHLDPLRNFDELTGIPNGSYLSKRIDEEVLRSNHRDGALAVAVCQIDDLPESNGTTAHTERIIKETATSLRRHARDFDVIGRTGRDEFTILLPEPGSEPAYRIYEMARSVASDAQLHSVPGASLTFGYAIYPADGEHRDALLERARQPRIRLT